MPNDYDYSLLAESHRQELKLSAIEDGIAALNFWSFEGNDENELDQVFNRLKLEPEHNNNGTLSGKSQNELANSLRGGGWMFEGHSGTSVKLNSPRSNADGKVIKYESVRDSGNQQLFIPKVTVKMGFATAKRLNIADEYFDRFDDFPKDRSLEDKGFWDWVISLDLPVTMIITEGAKKACSLISAEYLAIGLNGMWGWGCNVKAVDGEKADKYGNKLDDKGKAIKLIHSDLKPFLKNNIEIVWALDRDENQDNPDEHKKAIDGVKQSKALFKIHCGSLVEKISDTNWENHKGVDDLIAAEGKGAFQKAFNRSKKKVVPPATGKGQGQCNDSGGSTNEPKKPKSPLELAKVATYFHTADKVAYADILIEGNRHTYSVGSRAFKLWLSGEHYRANKFGLCPQSFKDTLPTLEAIAIFDGECREVNLRVAEHQGKLYLDLGTPDWKAVEIDATGWRVISEPPIRFSRPDSLLPLPYPVEGGSLDELKDLLNVDGSSWTLIITFLLFCFCPDKTYPVLVLAAHRGSGKTAAAEILKGLIDPGKAGLIKLQGDTHKLAIAATRRHLMVYDNVGHITPDQSDDLCRVATGFGYSTRTLHTTDDETTFEFTRPQIITAIDALVTRDDLADRVLMAQLPEIPEHKRLPQGKLNERVLEAKPRILGALLTTLSQTLAELPNTNADNLPRMADYAHFAIASEKAVGLKGGQFMAIFNESREQSRQVVIESSPVGEAIIRLMELDTNSVRWRGTASQLLKALENCTDEATYRSRFFPKTANLLSRQLNRLSPDLRAIGVDVQYLKDNGKERTRYICIQKGVKVSSVSSVSSVSFTEPSQGKAFSADDKPDDKPDDKNKPSVIVRNTVRAETSTGKESQEITDDADDTDDDFTPLSVNGETNDQSTKNREVPEDEF